MPNCMNHRPQISLDCKFEFFICMKLCEASCDMTTCERMQTSLFPFGSLQPSLKHSLGMNQGQIVSTWRSRVFEGVCASVMGVQMSESRHRASHLCRCHSWLVHLKVLLLSWCQNCASYSKLGNHATEFPPCAAEISSGTCVRIILPDILIGRRIPACVFLTSVHSPVS